MEQPEYLTPEELVARWNNAVNINTLANWRNKNIRRGPGFVKFGHRVRYPLSEVIKYESANKIEVQHQGEGSGRN